MNTLHSCLTYYLLAINAVTFITYGIDKYKAKKAKWRISEATLLLLAVLGGSIGAWMGMKVWHHSLKKIMAMTIDTTNLCSHLQKKLFEPEGIYYPIWQAMQNDKELTAVVRSRQLHIYRNGKKILILAGKAQPKIIREDKLNELINKTT